jgi:hypothetical protein
MDDFNFDLEAALNNPIALATVLPKAQARKAANLSTSTWQRLEERGEGCPVTQLSDNRIGYRLIDLIKWLDARRRAPKRAA